MDRHSRTLTERQRAQLMSEMQPHRTPQTLNASQGARLLRQAQQNPLVAQVSSVPVTNRFADFNVKATEITNLVEWEMLRRNDPSLREPLRLPPDALNAATDMDLRSELLQNSFVQIDVPPRDAPPEELAAHILATEEVHTFDLDRVAAHLKTSLTMGLSSNDHARRLAENGPNRLTPPKKTPWYVKLFKVMVGGFQLLLLAASVLCFVLYGISGDITNVYVAVVLIIVVLMTGLFSYYQRAKSDSLMEKFNKLTETTARVIRDGEERTVNAEELVIGDLVQVNSGERVPADLVVVQSTGLKVNNSSLTGECEPLARTTRCTHASIMETKNVMFCGTFVFEGAGRGVVFQTGDLTVIGQVALCSVSTKKPKTHLMQEINIFVFVMAGISIVLAVIFLIVALAAVKYPWQSALVFCIGILVANIPEGLLPQLCAQLYITAKTMARANVVVKNLEIIETLGCVTCIASDKTGTLTQNVMTAAHVQLDGTIYSTGALQNDDYVAPDLECNSFKLMQDIATLCSSATLSDDASDTSNPTEKAIVRYFGQYVDLERHRQAHPKLADIPFNSNNKWMLTLRQRPNTQAVRLYLKGAPERVLDRCTTVAAGGKMKPLAPERPNLERQNVELAEKGERVLALAYRDLDERQYTPSFPFNVDDLNFPSDGLCFVGLVALIDPPRLGVPESIQQCKEAGIRVIMVTGDHPVTAAAIARSIGILQSRGGAPTLEYQESVVAGDQLAHMDDAEWDRVLSCEGLVFARTLPQQKQMIVARLQGRKEMVAVTGDGVNDSPALKQASCGIAMGIMGSEIAKDAADVVLMDDNFCSIITGIRQGRLVYANMQKCIIYVVTHLVPEIVPVLLYVVIQIPPALTTLMVLSVDLGTDIPLGIALAWEEPENAIMQQPPRKSTDRLTSWRLFFFVYFQLGVLETLYCFIVFFVIFADYGFSPTDLLFTSQWFSSNYADMSAADQAACNATAASNPVWQAESGNWASFDDFRFRVLSIAQTGYLTSITISQFGNVLGCKTQFASLFRAGLKNWKIPVGALFAVIFNVLLVYTPFGWVIFGTAPLPGIYYALCLGGTAMMLLYHELIKLCLRHWPNGVVAFLVKY